MRSSREHKPTLLWSPHSTELFALGASDKLSLFEFQRPEHTNPHDNPADAGRFAGEPIGLDSLAPLHTPYSVRPVSTVTDVSQLTCATWNPRPEQPWTIAVGTATGKVVLHDCSPSASRSAGATSAIREFYPRQQRVCFSIAWNPVFTQLIAAGLDRDRRDYGVLVWDVERDTSSFVDSSRQQTTTAGGHAGAVITSIHHPGPGSSSIGAASLTAGRRATQPRAPNSSSSSCIGFDVTSMGVVDAVSSAHAYAPLANSEAAVAVSWVPDSPHSLLVGTSFRWLRLFDVRARDEQVSCLAHTKAVYGVVFDPFNPKRLLTFSDASETPAGVVKGWDLRRLSHATPLFTLAAGDGVVDRLGTSSSAASRTSQSRGLLQVGWCPTQRGLVGTMAEGGTRLYVWDVDQMILVQQSQEQGDRVPTAEPLMPRAGLPPAPPPASPAHAPSTNSPAHGHPPPLQLPAQLNLRHQQLLGRNPRLGVLAGVPPSSDSAGASNALNALHSSTETQTLELRGSDAPHCLQVHECDALLATFSWHLSHHARLLLLLRKGPQDSVLRQIHLSNPAPLSWSPSGELLVVTPERLLVFSAKLQPPPFPLAASTATVDEQAGSQLPSSFSDLLMNQPQIRRSPWCGRPLGSTVSEGASQRAENLWSGGAHPGADASEAFAADIVDAMRWRARADYGLSASASLALVRHAAGSTNTAEQQRLIEAWRWTNAARNMQASSEALRGHMAVLEASGGPSAPVPCTFSSLFVRESPGRSTIIRACGWNMCRDAAAIEESIACLEAAHQFERAALNSIFHAGAHSTHNGLERAVQALERGGSRADIDAERATVLRMTAMVVAGFAPNSDLWASTVFSTAARVGSPHLRLLLAALCCCCVAEQPAASVAAPETAPSRRRSTESENSADPSISIVDAHDQEAMLTVHHSLLEVLMAERLSESMHKQVPGVSGDQEGKRRRDTTEAGEACLLFSDAVAIACRFLMDDQLEALMHKLAKLAASQGSLSGLCLYGLTETALPLLQAYIDRTCDVQTAVALLLSAPQDVLGAPRPQYWLDMYRELLNRWQLYHARCRLDGAIGRTRRKSNNSVARGSGSSGVSVGGQMPSRIFARCAFCNSSLQTGGVARNLQAKIRGTAGIVPHQATRGNAGKASVCPNCKKALPRCALCLQHLGCPNPSDLPDLSSLGSLAPAPAGADLTPSPSSAFGHWMVWCQTCRHGGHAQHIEEWFELHDVCPVADCDCRCSLLDATIAEFRDAVIDDAE